MKDAGSKLTRNAENGKMGNIEGPKLKFNFFPWAYFIKVYGSVSYNYRSINYEQNFCIE